LVYLVTGLLADQGVGGLLVLQGLLVVRALQGKVIVVGLEVHQTPMTEVGVVVAQQAGVAIMGAVLVVVAGMVR
jgi:hypothetical protein